MSQLLARYWLVILALAIALDLAIVFGPSLASPHSSSSATATGLYFARWLTMISGIAASWRLWESEALSKRQIWCLNLYFVFGFTAAGALNSYLNAVT